MNIKRLAIWACVFAALLAYVLLVEKPEVKSQKQTERGDYEKLFGPDSGSIDAVRITKADRAVTIGRKGLKWQVTAPAGAEALPEQCESMITAVTDAVLVSVVEEAPKSLTQYGLDAPEMTICVNPDDAQKRKTLAFGKKAPSGVSIYGLDVERGRVVTVGTYLSFSATMFVDNVKAASRQE